MDAVLSIRNLVTEFRTPDGMLRAVDGIDLELRPGETLGLVGESGSGKSVTMMSALGLLPARNTVVSGEVLLDGRDLLRLPKRQLQRVRGRDVGVVFQDPMTSLNPVRTIGWQIGEAIWTHDPKVSRRAARGRVVDLLRLVGVPSPQTRVDQYPHEFSGGMRQRVMIAIAIANQPKVLIADEPTTALDVTIQAQVLDVLEAAKQETGAATILITHDLGIVAQYVDRAAVMYSGRIVEQAPLERLFREPHHPYTVGLLASVPRVEARAEHLVPIPGQPPTLSARPPGCAFHPRCPLASSRERCRIEAPDLLEIDDGHLARCHFSAEVAGYVHTIEGELGISLAGEPTAGTRGEMA
ncbi:ABC transporter ATP-binding protein [Ruania alba]|uniref:Peptide/nickel transport system ATP-binding protein n=1 Tax=Ruania alba TaxID=648782 RepID=A0A1H5HJ98_9MICO|nr:ABC transporter ATP-binding protein [Ruania alba]SEE27940.1 peptide/nickel transport system ATP-binding protein [Ruania alba]